MVALRKRNSDKISPANAGATAEPTSAEGDGGGEVASTPSTPPLPPSDAAPPTDDGASAALIAQINALRQAEQAQEHAAKQQQEAARHQHEHATAQQREIGEWLAQRPGLNEHPQAIALSRHLIQQGCVLGSPFWREQMEARGFRPGDYRPRAEIPESALATTEPQAAKHEQPTMDKTERDESARFVSAPVSRSNGPSYGGYRLSPSSIRLSKDERDIARASGMSDIEYARQKIKLSEMKAAGLLNDA